METNIHPGPTAPLDRRGDVRAALAEALPAFLQPLFTYLTGLAPKGSVLPKRRQATVILVAFAVHYAGLLLGLTAGAAGAVAAMALLPVAWTLSVAGARDLQLTIFHHCAHGMVISPAVSLWLGRLIGTILVIQPFDSYAPRHRREQLDPAKAEVEPALTQVDSEGFKGCNDLHFGQDGALYFTDQGQTGLHDPTGRVYRWDPVSDELHCLIDTAPSPNGLVLDRAEKVLFLAVTRANAVWRLPLTTGGRVKKAGLFLQFSGGRAGPDGLALTSAGGVVVCQTGMGLVWVHDALGRPAAVIRSPLGLGTTNCAFGGPGGRTLYITESDSGTILTASFSSEHNVAAAPIFGLTNSETE